MASSLDIQMGCQHYKRACKIIAPCCNEEYWCRHCHNDAKQGAHEVDRFAVEKIVCQYCKVTQAPSEKCTNCDKTFARYFCAKCKFWDDLGLTKNIFHCDDCGICRVGGSSNFFHCNKCGSCYPTMLRDSHRCIERAMNQGCPVCLEDLFSSIIPVSVLNCGHTIHQECLRKLTFGVSGERPDLHIGAVQLRCPICSVSIGSLTREVWENIDRLAASVPMPDEYKYDVAVLCNDCQRKGVTQNHIFGFKCQCCGSYNTRRIPAAELGIVTPSDPPAAPAEAPASGDGLMLSSTSSAQAGPH
eukprot:GDKH01001840.1.p1 GENE.GDKH01001840.1~~GDKH01001840.1.p1  ORF type:complete len:301 (-),score=21.96 GDKH01001840.1:248-1150(-)